MAHSRAFMICLIVCWSHLWCTMSPTFGVHFCTGKNSETAYVDPAKVNTEKFSPQVDQQDFNTPREHGPLARCTQEAWCWLHVGLLPPLSGRWVGEVLAVSGGDVRTIGFDDFCDPFPFFLWTRYSFPCPFAHVIIFRFSCEVMRSPFLR